MPLTFYYSICVVWREEVSAHHPVVILLRGMKWKSLFYSVMKGMIQSGGDHDLLHLTLYVSYPLFPFWRICLFSSNFCGDIAYISSEIIFPMKSTPVAGFKIFQ